MAGRGLLIVISGPSGVGKGTVCGGLLTRNTNMRTSVSATTRAMRAGESEGVSYFFKTKDEFKRMIENGEFLEYMEVFGLNFYGTPKKYVLEQLEQGKDVILEIDVKGALAIRKAYDDAVLIFIAPPDLATLEARLLGRGTEDKDAVARRLATAREELMQIDQYDYLVVNDTVDETVHDIETITAAERLRTPRQAALRAKLQEG
jgi:guanylate kinase